MITRVTASACANIALVKYWGKQAGGINLPATSSISLTLEKLKTVTKIVRLTGGEDYFFINKKPADKITSDRLKKYLDYWRNKGLIKGSFRIESKNSFPTKSGLASSSSGYAALAMGLSGFSTRKLSVKYLSELARIGSGSAARSITGGLSALPKGRLSTARLIKPAKQIPWGMVICEVDMAEKKISSREGMELSKKSSPYYKSWLTQSEKDYRRMLAVIKKRDLEMIGEIMEANTLAMHACMIATKPELLYWTGATLDILHAVRKWRSSGLQVYATMDAGPHVILLGKKSDLAKIASRARLINSVIKATASLPADGAEIISWN